MYLQESNKIPVKHIMLLYLVSMETFRSLLCTSYQGNLPVP